MHLPLCVVSGLLFRRSEVCRALRSLWELGLSVVPSPAVSAGGRSELGSRQSGWVSAWLCQTALEECRCSRDARRWRAWWWGHKKEMVVGAVTPSPVGCSGTCRLPTQNLCAASPFGRVLVGRCFPKNCGSSAPVYLASVEHLPWRVLFQEGAWSSWGLWPPWMGRAGSWMDVLSGSGHPGFTLR